jgi:hypothetical protein
MKAKVLAAAFFALFAAASAPALSLDLDINAGLLFIGSTGTVVAPSPLLPCIGVSFPISFSGIFFIEPGIDFYGLYYEWTGTRAVPTAVESNAGFFTLAALLSFQAGVRFPVGKALELGGSAGVDFLSRFPIELENNSSASVEGRAPSFAYFYSMWRALYPETRMYIKWKVKESNALLFYARAMYPVFHLWDGEALPFLDQLMISAGIGFTIRLK